MSAVDIITAISTFVLGCVAGGGFTFFQMSKNNTRTNSNNKETINQNNNFAAGDIVGKIKNEK